MSRLVKLGAWKRAMGFGLFAACILPTAGQAIAMQETPIKVEIKITSPDKVTAEVKTGKAEKDEDRPLIQVAILLDTSNSMDGLIGQARTQLWGIVNDLAETKKNGKIPRIEVALFEYGNDGLPVTENYLRQVVPLTDDLDKLSEALFALKTNGGSEYCGAVIDKASKVLNWKKGHDHYKAIFIAGNEAFTQGAVDYAVSCSSARSDGINVNTIHCGNESAGQRGKWKHGADLGGGRYMVINSDKKSVVISCPQDAVLIKLNLRLNKTYLHYGQRGRSSYSRQEMQDNLNLSAGGGKGGGGFAGRVASKGNSKLYGNSAWDLIDATKKKDFKLKDVKRATLPEKYQKMSDEELKKAIESLAAQRKKIQDEITKVAKARGKYLVDYRKKNRKAGNDDDTFGNVLREAASVQAAKKGFKKK